MERQYILSERAHYMCPDMHFAISFEVKEKYSAERVEQTVRALSAAHPFLCCVISCDDDGRPYYDCAEDGTIRTAVTEMKSYEEASEAYSMLTSEVWDISRTGLMKLFTYPSGEHTGVIMAAHHLLGDGRSILQLSMEFADFYAAGIAPERVEERLIKGIEELPAGSELKGISRYIVDSSSKKWTKENHRVSIDEYNSFSKEYGRSHPKTYRHYTVDGGELTDIVNQCRLSGVSMNDYLMAQMYIKTGTKKIIIAADIRNKLDFYRQGAMGNYATAMGIECRSKTAEVYKKAKEVHKLVADAMADNRRLMTVLACYLRMEPTLIDAAAISALGGFNSKAGLFVGAKMFGFDNPQSYSITNLGRYENEHMECAEFIPPASPAAKLTLGVLTVNGVMRLCSSETGKITP